MFIVDDFGTCLTPPPLLARLDSDIASNIRSGLTRRKCRLAIDVASALKRSHTHSTSSTLTVSTSSKFSADSLHSPGSDSAEVLADLARTHCSDQGPRRGIMARPVLSARTRAKGTHIHSQCKNPLLQCQHGYEYSEDSESESPSFTGKILSFFKNNKLPKIMFRITCFFVGQKIASKSFSITNIFKKAVRYNKKLK